MSPPMSPIRPPMSGGAGGASKGKRRGGRDGGTATAGGSKRGSESATAWPEAHEAALRAAVIEHGEGQWSRIAASMARFGRTDAECRKYWQSQFKIIKG